MALGFLLNKERMLKEIDQWTALRRIDTPQSICDCCVYRMFDFILVRECRLCSVHMGMLSIMNTGKQEALQ
jgi:hypothetical protein